MQVCTIYSLFFPRNLFFYIDNKLYFTRDESLNTVRRIHLPDNRIYLGFFSYRNQVFYTHRKWFEMQLYRQKHQFYISGTYLTNRIPNLIDSFLSSSAPEWPKPYKTIDLFQEHNPKVSLHYQNLYPLKNFDYLVRNILV